MFVAEAKNGVSSRVSIPSRKYTGTITTRNANGDEHDELLQFEFTNKGEWVFSF